MIEPTNVINCPREFHQPQHHHGQTDHGLKEINHSKVICNILAGDIHKTCGTHQSTTFAGGYLNAKGSFTGDRRTQLTRIEGSPAMKLWDTITYFFIAPAGGDSKPVHQSQILRHQYPFGYIDYVLPIARSFSMRAALYIFEGNEAVMKQKKAEVLQCVMYHAHIVSICFGFMSASIHIR